MKKMSKTVGTPNVHVLSSCLVLQNNQQTSSWSITLMVVVGHGMRTGAHLASRALKAAGFSCSTTTAGSWFQSLTDSK